MGQNTISGKKTEVQNLYMKIYDIGRNGMGSMSYGSRKNQGLRGVPGEGCSESTSEAVLETKIGNPTIVSENNPHKQKAISERCFFSMAFGAGVTT